MRPIVVGSTISRPFSLSDDPDDLPVVSVYAGETYLGDATVAATAGMTRRFTATYTVPSSGIAAAALILMRVNWDIDSEPQTTSDLFAGWIAPSDVAYSANLPSEPDNAGIDAINDRTSLIYSLLQLTDSDVALLLTRIAGTIRTAEDDAIAETAQAAEIRSGLALKTDVDSAAQSVIDHGDGDGAWGAVGSSGGGDATEAKQDQILAAIEGLGSVSITRIGPEFEPATKTVTLYAGDDYLADNSNALTFAVTLPGVSLTGASAVFAADAKYQGILRGTATLLDTNTDNPKLRLEWTRAQTLAVEPSDKLSWGVAIVDAGNRVQTIIGGPLKLKRALVNPAVTQAVIDA